MQGGTCWGFPSNDSLATQLVDNIAGGAYYYAFCNAPCPGDATQRCGGGAAFDLYQANLQGAWGRRGVRGGGALRRGLASGQHPSAVGSVDINGCCGGGTAVGVRTVWGDGQGLGVKGKSVSTPLRQSSLCCICSAASTSTSTATSTTPAASRRPAPPVLRLPCAATAVAAAATSAAAKAGANG